MTTYPVIMSDESVTVFLGDDQHTVYNDNPNFDALKKAIKDQDWQSVPRLVSPVKAINEFGLGKVKVVDGEIHYEGEPTDKWYPGCEEIPELGIVASIRGG